MSASRQLVLPSIALPDDVPDDFPEGALRLKAGLFEGVMAPYVVSTTCQQPGRVNLGSCGLLSPVVKVVFSYLLSTCLCIWMGGSTGCECTSTSLFALQDHRTKRNVVVCSTAFHNLATPGLATYLSARMTVQTEGPYMATEFATLSPQYHLPAHVWDVSLLQDSIC